MVYLAIALVSVLVGVLTTVWLAKVGQPKDADPALEALEESHQREHKADVTQAKTADPVDYLNTGLDRLR